MVFSSATFLFLFLPLITILYYLSPSIKFKNFVLLISSLIFLTFPSKTFATQDLHLALRQLYSKLILEFCADSKIDLSFEQKKVLLFFNEILNIF